MSEAIMILEQAKQIYEDHYTVVDKRTCKVKRNIALIHIRMENYPDALKELNEVLVSYLCYLVQHLTVVLQSHTSLFQ